MRNAFSQDSELKQMKEREICESCFDMRNAVLTRLGAEAEMDECSLVVTDPNFFFIVAGALLCSNQ